MKFREDDLLIKEVRQQIIEAIVSDQNRARKDEAFRRYQIYKDNSVPYVQEKLLAQFAQDTVKEMSFGLSNLAIVRKVIEKLGRVYSYQVKRSVQDDDESTKSIEQLSKILKLNTVLKKTNRFLKLQRNVAVFPRPIKVDQPDGSEKYTIKVDAMQPYQFDVIEHCEDPETPVAFIFSNYIAQDPTKYTADAAVAGRTPSSQYQALINKAQKPTTKETIIADGGSRMKVSPVVLDRLKEREKGAPVQLGMPEQSNTDRDPKKLAAPFVFWSTKYHFTCDEDGDIIGHLSPLDLSNPISMLPLESLALDQDGSFWAQGGRDLIDGHLLINCMITHLNYIGVNQGYGQMWMRGKDVPKTVKVGPQRVIRLEWGSTDDPTPEFGYANSNAPLGDLKSLIEMYVALLLTTNNLSTSGVSTQLQGGSNFASGIALLVDKAESVEDVQDQESVFQDAEPNIWKKIQAWLDVYGSAGLLVDSLKDISLKPEFILNLKFGKPETIVTEAERLQNIKTRQELKQALNTHVEYIMMDNPGMTKEDAEKKLEEILKEKIELAANGPEVDDSSQGNNPEDEEEATNASKDELSERSEEETGEEEAEEEVAERGES